MQEAKTQNNASPAIPLQDLKLFLSPINLIYSTLFPFFMQEWNQEVYI